MKDWPYPRVVAHRGGGSLAPENTLAAIRVGQELGYRAHEFDVKLTRDGVAILMHDEKLERTTNGTGRPADVTYADLQVFDAGSWHSDAFRGEPIPTFEDAASLFDAKTGRAVAQLTRRLWQGAKVSPIFSSFSFEALMAAKEAAPEIPRGWLIAEFTDADWDRLAALDATSLHTSFRTFPIAQVTPLHERGYRIMLYTVNDQATARTLLDAGVDGVFTDNLRAFASAFPDLI
jgi:glycerophosphoryl diester phosphodiesterase